MNWGEIIKNRRTVLGVSQQNLADISGVSLRTIKIIESGVSNPSVDTLCRVGKALGLELVFKIRNT